MREGAGVTGVETEDGREAGTDISLRSGTGVWSTRFADSFRSASFSPADLDPELVSLLPLHIAKRAQAIPLARGSDGSLVIAMANPSDLGAVDSIRSLIGDDVLIDLRSAPADMITAGLARVARIAASAAEADSRGEVERDLAPTVEVAEDDATDADGPIARLVDDLIAVAASAGATDIHLEPGPGFLAVRMRIDSVLREHSRISGSAGAPVVRRVKVLAGMDISDRIRFQDGRFDLSLSEQQFDARVVTLPTRFGEAVAIRLLDTSRSVRPLAELGFSGHIRDQLHHQVGQPHGLVLVCGPTGSGKTTTLYSTLSEVDTATRKVLAVEDPVEIRMPGVLQVQVNDIAGVTFASALRSFLRADPDVLLVGEIRDEETARLAIQAAQTGHLVLSTLHTNTAASAAARLVDLGIHPWLVSDTLRGVLSQRLVRRVCTSCSVDAREDANVTEWLSGHLGDGYVNYARKSGKGCHACDKTGYRGLTAVGELITVDEHIGELISRRGSSLDISAAARNAGTIPLNMAAAHTVASGLTDVDELKRVGL